MVQDELKLSDKLALDRTIMAADRTLMAWVRTALSLISFGFTIYKVLQQFQAAEGGGALRPQGPRNVGLLLIFLGTWVLGMGMAHHWGEMRNLGKSWRAIIASTGFILAAVLSLFGAFLFITILLQAEVF